MPVKIQCPLCGTEMTVSDAAMGTTVGCPWCRHRFRPDPAMARPDAKPGIAEVAPAAPAPLGEKKDEMPRAKAEPRAAKERLPSASVGSPGTPVAGDRGAEAVPSEEERLKREALRATRGEKGRPAGRGSPAASVAPPAPRKKVARLILTQTAEPAWKLAPDGSLPSLHLDEESGDEKKRETKRSGNPVLLAVVLVASLLTSLALLFVEPVPTSPGNVEERNRAREELAAEYYSNLNPNTPLAEYQRLLREAHWAHSRGDHQREKELYRRVLLLLYAEKGRNSYTGLTGSRSRDERLEELLRILLKE